MNIERTFEAALWRYWWRHHHEKYFFGIIREVLFISHILPDVVPEVGCTSKIAMIIRDIWAFDRRSSCNIDGNTSVLKIDLFCDIINYFMNTHLYINVVIISWYLCPGCLMMIYSPCFRYHDKCCYFIHKGILGADFWATRWRHWWRHHCEKILFWHNLGRSFHIWGPVEAAFNI